MFAASSLLLYVTRVRTPTQCPPIVKSIEMAIEILEAMDDSVVARKSADIVKQTLKEARGTTIDSVISPSNPHSGMQTPISQTFGNGFMDVVSKIQAHSNLISGYWPLENQSLFSGFEFPDYSLPEMASLFDEWNDANTTAS